MPNETKVWDVETTYKSNLENIQKKIKTVSEIFNRLLPSQTVLNQSLVRSLWWSWNIFCYPAWPQKMTKEVSQSHLRSICYHLRHLEIIFTFNASEFSWYQCAYLVLKKIVKKPGAQKQKLFNLVKTHALRLVSNKIYHVWNIIIWSQFNG